MLVDSDYIYFFIFVFNSLLEDSWDCGGRAPAASDDRRLYSQATLSVKNQDILNDDALHFKLARSVLEIALFEFANLKYFNFTFTNLKNARLVLNAKCEIVVFTSVTVL